MPLQRMHVRHAFGKESDTRMVTSNTCSQQRNAHINRRGHAPRKIPLNANRLPTPILDAERLHRRSICKGPTQGCSPKLNKQRTRRAQAEKRKKGRDAVPHPTYTCARGAKAHQDAGGAQTSTSQSKSASSGSASIVTSPPETKSIAAPGLLPQAPH